MKRFIQLFALVGIAGLLWWIWSHFGKHVGTATASADRQAALDYQRNDWPLPWELPINAYNYIAADIARAVNAGKTP